MLNIPKDIAERIHTYFPNDPDRALFCLYNYPVDYHAGLSQGRVWRAVLLLSGANVKLVKVWVDRALLNPEKVVRKAEFGSQKDKSNTMQLYDLNRSFDDQSLVSNRKRSVLRRVWDKFEWAVEWLFELIR